MTRLFTLGTALYAAFLTACTPQDVALRDSGAQNLPSRRAYFATDPAELHSAFRSVCDAPGDQFTQPDRQTAICRFLPSPALAAYLLTRYDGKIEVPKLVVQKITRDAETGVEIEISYYAEVAQKSGQLRRIYAPNPTLDRRIDKMLRVAGGRIKKQ